MRLLTLALALLFLALGPAHAFAQGRRPAPTDPALAAKKLRDEAALLQSRAADAEKLAARQEERAKESEKRAKELHESAEKARAAGDATTASRLEGEEKEEARRATGRRRQVKSFQRLAKEQRAEAGRLLARAGELDARASPPPSGTPAQP